MAALTGAWADHVENEEATNGALANNSDFPSLGEAAKAPPQGKKPKSKGQKLSLTAFMAQSSGPAGGFQDKSLQDKAILASLPTAPRGLREGETAPAPGLGGGFREYGGNREGGFRGGDRGDRGDRPPRAEMEPSRADTVDDWGSTRKFVPGGGDGGSRGFGGGGGFGDRDRGAPRGAPREFNPSAADQVDDWGSTRKFEPSGPRGGGGFGGEDRRGFGGDRERRFDGPPPPSKADLEDSWGRGRDFKPSEASGSGRPRGFSDAPASQADKEDRWARRGPEASTSAAPESSGASERPRLKLQPRTAPVEGASSSGAGDDGGKKSNNPFGAARPREEVLKEKGVDPIKEALKLEHGEVIRDDTPAEIALKEEVAALQKQLEELKTSSPDGDEAKELAGKVDAKERELLKLQAEEDDKVRFSRGRTEARDGAAAGGRAQQGGSKEPPAPRKDRW